jgi:hypothetical protein
MSVLWILIHNSNDSLSSSGVLLLSALTDWQFIARIVSILGHWVHACDILALLSWTLTDECLLVGLVAAVSYMWRLRWYPSVPSNGIYQFVRHSDERRAQAAARSLPARISMRKPSPPSATQERSTQWRQRTQILKLLLSNEAVVFMWRNSTASD